jgi:predicted ribosomally synthesized peptide with nif11-like leader
MSKEHAFRFMMAKSKDDKIKSSFDVILSKCQEKNLSDDERDSVLEEISQLAKKYGFYFTPEDLKELQKNAEGKLSDEELSEVAGGRGQFSRHRSLFWWECSDTCICECAKDDSTFAYYYCQDFTNCPNYEWKGYGLSTHQCSCCSHFQCS